ncbi:MAG TPA: phospholipase D-like domain-containing protein [Saprospiraceae bacterium]|nr:phospholipase D-like domain-containing protein [Saprospiraceae bacterium]
MRGSHLIGKQTAASPYAIYCFAACVACISLFSDLRGQESILQARQRPVGSVVTVTGIVLNSSELGAVRYFQDSTSGIAVYPGGDSPSSFDQVTRSDEVQVTGVLSTYHGLLEINPILSFQKLSSGNALPEAVDISVDALSFHDQGKLVRVNCVRFPYTPGNFEAGSVPFCTSQGDRSSFYFEGSNPLVNTVLPVPSLDITAIVSYYDDWRFLIRSLLDIKDSECFHISPTPRQSEITQEGFRLQWISTEDAQGFCLVKREDGEVDTIRNQEFENIHSVTITGLQPAEFCEVIAGGVNLQGDTALYSPIMMSTQSAGSGDIEIYFNQSVDVSYSNGSLPDGTSFVSMLATIFSLINNAQHSIDVAMYNSNRTDIILALEQAMQRGVRIRYIGDGGQSNSALDPLPDFPLLFRNGDGIMHHKVIIVDPLDPLLARVWTGSTNHSTNQLSADPNNAIVIQDQSLVKAYLAEFEEMWGGSGNTPNPLLSRTGSVKRDNTPHLFQIGDILIENYFSPSDQTNHEIRSELVASEESIDVALLLLTRYDLTEAMTGRANAGVDVRLIVDDVESSLGPLQELQSAGVLTAYHDYNSIFHHKYAILDEGTDEARVITGSHNWTTSATVRNDENTLIIHDPDIANIYRQEFEARWAEVFSIGIHDATWSSTVKTFPNPVDDRLCIDAEGGVIHSLRVCTVMGVQVISRNMTDSCVDISELPSGMYFANVQLEQVGLITIPFVKY